MSLDPDPALAFTCDICAERREKRCVVRGVTDDDEVNEERHLSRH